MRMEHFHEGRLIPGVLVCRVRVCVPNELVFRVNKIVKIHILGSRESKAYVEVRVV